VDGVALPRTSYGGPIGAGPYALVSVRDPGLGEEFIDQQVFDSYTPTGGWDTPQADHWLGLYVGAQVLLLHGGVIWTEHRPGDGGTVCYAIPLA
ncbi:MAG: hypothetical protein RLZZ387_254, partial [Chloroflexota bacterium]